MSISLNGVCPAAAAQASAILLDLDGLHMVEWRFQRWASLWEIVVETALGSRLVPQSRQTDSGRYLARTRFIGTRVLGQEFYEILEKIPAWNEEPEVAEPLYRRAFDLFAEGCERFRRDPTEYEYLLTWTGRPRIQHCLIEESIDFSNDYEACLDQLIEKLRSSGNQDQALECERQRRRLKELLKDLLG